MTDIASKIQWSKGSFISHRTVSRRHKDYDQPGQYDTNRSGKNWFWSPSKVSLQVLSQDYREYGWCSSIHQRYSYLKDSNHSISLASKSVPESLQPVNNACFELELQEEKEVQQYLILMELIR